MAIRSRLSIALGLAAALLALAGSAEAASSITEKELIGQWESPSWSLAGKPVFVRFKADGTFDFNGAYWLNKGEWLLLDSGQLQVVVVGITGRCNVAYADKTMTITPAGCFKGWEGFDPSIMLRKQ